MSEPTRHEMMSRNFRFCYGAAPDFFALMTEENCGVCGTCGEPRFVRCRTCGGECGSWWCHTGEAHDEGAPVYTGRCFKEGF